MPFLLDPQQPDTFAPFNGDGRTKVRPNAVWSTTFAGSTPLPVTRAFARNLIAQLWEAGTLKMTPLGGYVWVLQAWANSQGLELKVVKHPFGGWYARIIESDDDTGSLETTESDVLESSATAEQLRLAYGVDADGYAGYGYGW